MPDGEDQGNEAPGSFLRVRFGDGEADVYLNDAGMMANEVSGRDPWTCS